MPIIVRIMPNLSAPNRLVVALAYNGLCAFEFGITAEVFGLHRPEMGDDWYRFETCAETPGKLATNAGLCIEVEHGLDTLAGAGTIIIPGWRSDGAVPSMRLKTALLDAHRSGTRIVSICSGAFLLASIGLLSGRRATTHWRYAEHLRRTYPEIEVDPDVLYVDAGDVLTSAGSAAGIDLLLHVIRKDFGSQAVNNVARRLVTAPHRAGGQAQFIERPVPPHAGDQLAKVLDAVRADPKANWTVSVMASLAAMSERSFARRFLASTGISPGAWVGVQRLAAARELLETTNLSVERIAEEVGLGSAANLRMQFRAETGLSPKGYRDLFGGFGAGPERK